MGSEPEMRLVPPHEIVDIDALVERRVGPRRQAPTPSNGCTTRSRPPCSGWPGASCVTPWPRTSRRRLFLEVWRKAARFDRSLGKAKTWIMTIAHRRSPDRREKEAGQGDVVQCLVQIGAVTPALEF